MLGKYRIKSALVLTNSLVISSPQIYIGTQGLALSGIIHDTGHPLEVPVDKALQGRMFNVFGHPIDKKPMIENTKVRTIHGPPPEIENQSVSTRIFETGIKVIDILSPVEQGEKAGFSAVPAPGRPC